MGTAVKEDNPMSIWNRPLKGGMFHGILVLGYILPFITILVILAIVLRIIYKDGKKVKNFREKVEKDSTLQANLVATTLVCFYGTIYIFALDMLSIIFECMGTLPRYFGNVAKSEFYGITLNCSIVIILLYFIIGIFFFVSSLYMCKKYRITVVVICCIGSTVLSLSFHFQNVLIAWTATPLYAEKIALFYGIVIFVLFVSFKYTYILSTKVVKGCMAYIVFIIFTILVTINVVIVTSFVAFFPTNHSIEQSITALTTISNGAIFLGGLLAYKFFFNGTNGVQEKSTNQMNDNVFR